MAKQQSATRVSLSLLCHSWANLRVPCAGPKHRGDSSVPVVLYIVMVSLVAYRVTAPWGAPRCHLWYIGVLTHGLACVVSRESSAALQLAGRTTPASVTRMERSMEAETSLSAADLLKSTPVASRQIMCRECRVPETLLEVLHESSNCRYPLRIVQAPIFRKQLAWQYVPASAGHTGLLSSILSG